MEGASLCCGDFSDGSDELPLPPLTAVVTSFPQEHLDEDHDPVEGMLGMEMLGLFDADFDWPKGRLRLYRPGEGAEAARAAGLVEVPAAGEGCRRVGTGLGEGAARGQNARNQQHQSLTSQSTHLAKTIKTKTTRNNKKQKKHINNINTTTKTVVNESGLLAIRATSPGAPSPQPFTALLDCGASFSAVNWSAAQLAGLPPGGDRAYSKGPSIFSVGVDGRPVPYPTHPFSLTWVGEPSKTASGLSFAAPPREWAPWAGVDAAVGDLPVFSQLLGDPGKPYDGPAVLVGLDVLSQRRVMLCAGEKGAGRRRRLFVSGR